MSLKVADPIDVTDSIFTASDIPEPDPAQGEIEWEDREQVFTAYEDSFGDEVYAINSTDTGFTYVNGKFNGGSNGFMKIDESDNSVSYFGADDGLVLKSGYYDKKTKSIYYGSTGGNIIELKTSDDSLVNHATPAGFFQYSAVSDGGGYIYFSGGSQDVLKFDVNTKSMSIIYSGISGIAFAGSPGGDGFIYMFGSDGDIYKINPSNDSVSVIQSPLEFPNSAHKYGDNSIYVFNTNGYIYKFLLDSEGVSQVSQLASSASSCVNASDGFIYCVGDFFDGVISRQLVSRFDPGLGLVKNIGIYTDSSNKILVDSSESGSQIYISGDTYLRYIKNAYTFGDEIISTETHRRYSAAASTIDNPVDGIAKTPPTWIDIGPTNKWAMFDDKTTRQTVSASDFSVTLDPVNQINTVAFLNLSGVTSIRIEVRDKDEVLVYDETFDLIDTTPIYDYYTFFFYQQSLLEQLVDDVIPAYYDPEIKVTFTGADMSVGEMVAGFATQIGTTLSDTSSDTYDYSTQEFDEFGEINYVERPIVNLNTYEILSDKAHNTYIQRLVKKLRGKNALWIGNIGGGQKLITYGRYERSPIPIDMVDHVQYSITVRGSI